MIAAGSNAGPCGDFGYEYDPFYVEEWMGCFDVPVLIVPGPRETPERPPGIY